MSSPAASSPSRSWSPKRYLVLALAGTLVASVIVVAVSAVLSPAAIHFSVVKATHAYQDKSPAGMYLNFTIAANNSGWRAGVKYRRFAADLVYHPAWGRPRLLPPAYSNKTRGVGTSPSSLRFVQPPRNTTEILVPLFVGTDDWSKLMGNGEEMITPMSVQVRATVRFMVGMAQTRSYAIAVLCHLNVTLFTNGPVVSYNNSHTAPCVAAGLVDLIQ